MSSAAFEQQQRIPGYFQLLLALYILLTGSFPTIVQSLAYGVQGGAGSEFATAMVTAFALDMLLIVPVLVLANHPLGIVHPLLLAILVWPILNNIPTVIEDWGGWAGILAGKPVNAPYFEGLPGRSDATVWTAVAKYNGIQIIGLACTYLGFGAIKLKPRMSKIGNSLPDMLSVRNVMLALMAIGVLVIAYFVYTRGGVNEHLTSLGRGRFHELSQYGAIILAVDLAFVALLVWAAARPVEVKSPLFLAGMAAVMAAIFISNGSRGGALLVPMFVGIIWTIRRQRVPWKIALMLVPVMFLAIGLLGAVRTSSWYGTNANQAFANTGWAESFALAQEEVAARHAISANVPVIERGFAVTKGPLLGTSYIASIAAAVPRPLWPGKPRGVGSLYAQLFMGQPVGGNTIPVSPEAEMYWNFGLLGVIALSIAYGVLIRMAYLAFWRRYPNPFATVFYVMFITKFQFSSNRLVDIQQQAFVIFICYAVVVLFVPQAQVAVRPWLQSGRGGGLPPGRKRPLPATGAGLAEKG